MRKLEMRKSKALERLRDGKVVSCMKLNFYDSRAVELACIAGFDCLWVDTEHTPEDWLSVEKQILAAKAHDTDIIVRVARGAYSAHIKPLELDATGIMVPHVMNASDARGVARMTRFFPVGMRPADGGNADGMYCALPFADYIKQANERRMVIVQIEDVSAADDLEEICQVEGIDMVFFGPGDYSQSVGVPGEINHPDVQALRARIPQVAKRYGKFAGTLCSIPKIKETADMGYQFISVGADVVGLYNYFSECRDAIEPLR